MNSIDYGKAIPVAQSIIKVLEQQDTRMTYGKFWIAMGLGPWKAHYSRKCVKNILEMLDAIDRRAHGKRVLQLYRIVRADNGMCGEGIYFANHITRRPLTEEEAQEVSFGQVEVEHISRIREEAVAAHFIPDPADPNCTSGEA